MGTVLRLVRRNRTARRTETARSVAMIQGTQRTAASAAQAAAPAVERPGASLARADVELTAAGEIPDDITMLPCLALGKEDF